MTQPAAGPVHHHIDLSARTRSTVSEAQRYTKFVAVMKRVLLIAALLLLGAVLAYTLAPRSQGRVAMTFKSLGMVNNDLAMIKPKLTGSDAKGNPYLVTADVAIQDARDTKRARLQNVAADLTTNNGGWINIEAPHGYLDQGAQTLSLSGDISTFTDTGYEAHTTLVYIDLDSNIVVGPHYVRGQGPMGTFSADKFRIEKPSKKCDARKHPTAKEKVEMAKCRSLAADAEVGHPKIYLYGNVRMTMYEKGRSKIK